MKIISTLFIAAVLLVTGCSSALDRQYAEAIRRLRQINANQLISESQSLLKKLNRRDMYDIPKDQWPETIKHLNPVTVISDGSGIEIILKRWASKESGFYIAEAGYNPTNNPSVVYRIVQPDLYWYAL